MAEIENLQIVGGAIYTVGNQDIIADDWEAGKAYIKDRSYAIKDHKLYQCAVSHTSVEPFDPTKWTEKTVAEALGTAGSANMIECTLAEYTAWKAGGQLINETVYVITDAPNLNATAQDISYDGGADTVYDEVESLKNKEFYKVRITQVVIPSKTCTANVSNQLLDSVDIKTLTYDALDNISGFSETLIGAVFLWSNGGAAYATDTLVLNGKLTLYVCPNASSIITKIRLLTFWR